MKKLVSALLIVLLCFAVASAEGEMLSRVMSEGFEPEVVDNKDGEIRCDYGLIGSATARLIWSDASQSYTVSGDAAELSRIYLDALATGGWTAARYIVAGEIQLSYGVPSRQQCETLEAYAAQVQAALDLQSAASVLSGFSHVYVLNKRTKKFHHPDCSGIRKMSAKNREEYLGSREAVIAMGYSPCGICQP